MIALLLGGILGECKLKTLYTFFIIVAFLVPSLFAVAAYTGNDE